MVVFPILFGLVGLFSSIAQAREYDTYRADYFKGAFCSAIGGACAADTDLISGLFQNPAALATGTPKWDFDGDYASRAITEPGISGNNGAAESFAVGGIGFSSGKFGAGVAFVWRKANVNSPSTIFGDNGSNLSTTLSGTAYSTQLRLPMGYYFDNGVSVGATLSLNSQHQELSLRDASQRVDMFPAAPKIRISFGTLVPVNERIRIGSWLRLPVSLEDSIRFSSSTTGVISYKEDFSLHAPWIWGTGIAYATNPRWQLFAETDLIGSTTNGFLFSYKTFSSAPPSGALVEKGRSIVLEPHAGARYSINDRLRVHMGSYFENSRWERVSGRLHGTGGISYEFGKYVEIIAGLDVARKFSQLFFTFR